MILPAKGIDSAARNSSKKVLIVDDAMDARTILATNLKSEGLRIYQARDGMEGYRKFFRIRPDVVLLDILLPKMRGDIFVKWVKGTELGRETPIIVISGHTPMKEYLFQLGIELFFEKPFKTKDVLSAVRDVLDIYENKRALQKRLIELKLRFGKESVKADRGRHKICEVCQSSIEHAAMRCPNCGSVRLQTQG